MNRENLLTKEEFFEEIRDGLSQSHPLEEGTTYNLATMYKINDVKLCALSARGPERTASPNLYLDEFYDEYLESGDFDTTLNHVASVFRGADMRSKDIARPINMDITFDSIKDRLMVQVVDMKLNKNRLENVLHTELGAGFAATYHILVSEDANGRNTIPITKELPDNIGCTKEEIHNIAFANMEAKHPATIIDLESQMMRLMSREPVNAKPIGSDIDLDNTNIIYVVTTTDKANGATALWYRDVKKQIGNFLGQHYYVLPSSFHEVLIVPKSAGLNSRELLSMVVDANQQTVGIEDKLADKVLSYNRDRDKLYVAATPEIAREEAR